MMRKWPGNEISPAFLATLPQEVRPILRGEQLELETEVLGRIRYGEGFIGPITALDRSGVRR